MARTKTELQADIESLQEQLNDLRLQLEAEQGTRLNLAESLRAASRVAQSNGDEATRLRRLCLDLTGACSLLALQVTFPELHGRILDAKVHTA
jgi:hypothetical protein